MRVTRFSHLNNQTNLGCAPRNRANLFKTISSRFDDCCILRAKSRRSTCIWCLSVERYCARVVLARYRSAASLPIGTFPSISSALSLMPGLATDLPVTPSDFLISSACRGSAFQVVPSAVFSTILPSTRMLCTQSWFPGDPRIPRFVTTQARKKKKMTLMMAPELLL